MSQLTRRQLLKSAGLTAGAFALSRRAAAQTKAGTLISAQTTEATGLDPQLVPALSRSRRSPLTYNQLVRFEPDMTPAPELAESWLVSPDGLTWTFKLRQGVKFHDGQEFTSADVKFSFDRLLDKSAAGKSDFNAVDKIEPAGKYSVKFVTKAPFAALVAALGGFWGFIVSEAGVKKYGDLNKAALGTGPFILEDWKVEQQMVFKRNPNYFKKGLPHTDELIVRVIPDEANIVAALRTGQVHHAFIEDNKNYSLLKDEKSLTGYRSSRLSYDYLNMSANRGPLGDVRVRQAISWAVDRSQVMRVATAGFGRLTAPCTAPMKQWQLPEEQWMKYYKPDLERAKKLMAEAGVRIGFNMEIENVEYAVWIKRWLAHDFDMTMNSTPGYADPDVAFFRPLHSTRGQNWNSWSVPAVDALLEEGRRTMDQKKRKEIYDRLQIAILENVPHLWLYSADLIDFTQASVKGFRQHQTALLYGLEGAAVERA